MNNRLPINDDPADMPVDGNETTEMTVAAWCGEALGLLVAKVSVPKDDVTNFTVSRAWLESHVNHSGDLTLSDLRSIAVRRRGNFIALIEVIAHRVSEECFQ